MNLLISFSGGKTSAYMTKWLLENKRSAFENIVIVFANTGQESEETLKFVNQCDVEWGLGVVWIEIDPSAICNRHSGFKIVNFESASRNGEPFEAMIKEYGIPNQAWPHCTRELKTRPITAYVRSLGWKKGAYQTAIGIRIDEMDRVNSKMKQENIIYPLIEFTKATKDLINLWWDRQPFSLNIPEHKGNCTWCWKKSKRKLLTLAVDEPNIFEFPLNMENAHGLAGHNIDGSKRVFFRNNTSTLELLEESKKPFTRYVPMAINFDLFVDEMDAANGCSESCEIL